MPVIRCPEANIIGPRLAQALFPDTWASNESVRQALIKLALLKERAAGLESINSTYIAALPKDLESPIFWGEQEREWLQGTNLFGEIAAKVAMWHTEWEKVLAAVGLETDSDKGWLSFDEYKWASGIFMSRAFPARILYKTPECENLTMLVPIVDALNHKPNTAVQWDGGNGDAFTLSLCQSVSAGDEIFNNYGPKNNEELLLGYGFTLDDAEKFDVVMLRLVIPPTQSRALALGGIEIKDGSVTFQLSNSKDLDPKMIAMFSVLSTPPTGDITTFTLAQTLTGLGILTNAIRQKLQALDAGTPTKPPAMSSLVSLRFEHAHRYRASQRLILSKSVSECQTLISSKLSSASAKISLEAVEQDPYFAAIHTSLSAIFGVSSAEDFEASGVYDQALCIVLCYERLRGSSSRYQTSFDKVWGNVQVDADSRDMYLELYESLFPAVLDVDSEIFGLDGWSGELLAEAGAVLDRYGWESEGLLCALLE